MRKTTTFAAGLALAQNAPHIALEIIGTVRQQNYMTVRNIRVVALAQLGRQDDALPILRSVLDVNGPTDTKHTFTKDVVESVKEAVNKSGDQEVIQHYNRIEKALVDNGHISDTVSLYYDIKYIKKEIIPVLLTLKTLDSLLTAEIVSTAQSVIRKDRSVLAASYSNDRHQQQYSSRNNYSYSNNQGNNSFRPRHQGIRPGLKDLN